MRGGGNFCTFLTLLWCFGSVLRGDNQRIWSYRSALIILITLIILIILITQKGLPILALSAVAEHREVRLVAAGGNASVQCRFIDRATGFPRVGAVAVAAVAGDAEDFAEVVPHLLFLHVDSAEAFDTRGVDNPTSMVGQGVHLREGGRVGAFVVGVRDGTRARQRLAEDGIKQGALPYARVAAQQRDLIGEDSGHSRQVRTIQRRDGVGSVAERLVERAQVLQRLLFLGTVEVYLVEDKRGRYAIRLAGGEEAVNEGGGGDGVVHRNEERHLVEVGGDDMRLLAQIRGAADDVILSLADGGNPIGAIGKGLHLHMVAHSNGVRRADTFNAEITLDMTIKGISVRKINKVTATRGFDDQTHNG